MAHSSKIKNQALRVSLAGMLTALAIALSWAESLIPALPWFPPGAKPGLSNLATVFASFTLGILPALGIVILKALFVGMTRGIVAMLLSLCGGCCSTLLTWSLLRQRKCPFGMAGIGILGALTHNAVQLALSIYLTGPSMILYFPWLLIFGICTGMLTGMLMKLLFPPLLSLYHRHFPTGKKRVVK